MIDLSPMSLTIAVHIMGRPSRKTKTKTKTKTDWLMQFPGSKNWFIRLRDESGKRVVRSLGTPDRETAVILSLPLVAEHKERLRAARPHLEAGWKLEPGREHAAPDGNGKIVATDRELIHIGDNGGIVKIEPNRSNWLVNLPKGAVLVGDSTPLELRRRYRGAPIINLDALNRPKVATKDDDDAIIDEYLAKATPRVADEARGTWRIYKGLVDKPLKDQKRADGLKLVEYFKSQPGKDGKLMKAASVNKRIGWLRAAVNLAIKNEKLTTNPFAAIGDPVPKKRPRDERRQILDEDDIALCKAHLDEPNERGKKLSAEDQLLFRILATTGMRLSEPYQIIGEERTRDGIRYVHVGTKTDASDRFVPLPADLIPYLPEKIVGQLLPLKEATAKATAVERSAAAASKRLNRFLDECGITDKRKTVHSLRHRASSLLIETDCPDKVRFAIGGWEDPERDQASDVYAHISIGKLKYWIDKIGF
jgi:integrase